MDNEKKNKNKKPKTGRVHYSRNGHFSWRLPNGCPANPAFSVHLVTPYQQYVVFQLEKEMKERL